MQPVKGKTRVKPYRWVQCFLVFVDKEGAEAALKADFPKLEVRSLMRDKKLAAFYERIARLIRTAGTGGSQ